MPTARPAVESASEWLIRGVDLDQVEGGRRVRPSHGERGPVATTANPCDPPAWLVGRGPAPRLEHESRGFPPPHSASMTTIGGMRKRETTRYMLGGLRAGS